MRYEPNPEELWHLVGRYLDARIGVQLNVHRLQACPEQELDAAVRAEELRDYWRAHPGCVWRDGVERGDEPDDYWDVDALLTELDARAHDLAITMAEQRGITLPEEAGYDHTDD